MITLNIDVDEEGKKNGRDLGLTDDDETILEVSRRGTVEIDPATVVSAVLSSYIDNLQSS